MTNMSTFMCMCVCASLALGLPLRISPPPPCPNPGRQSETLNSSKLRTWLAICPVVDMLLLLAKLCPELRQAAPSPCLSHPWTTARCPLEEDFAFESCSLGGTQKPKLSRLRFSVWGVRASGFYGRVQHADAGLSTTTGDMKVLLSYRLKSLLSALSALNTMDPKEFGV